MAGSARLSSAPAGAETMLELPSDPTANFRAFATPAVVLSPGSKIARRRTLLSSPSVEPLGESGQGLRVSRRGRQLLQGTPVHRKTRITLKHIKPHLMLFVHCFALNTQNDLN